MENINAQKNFLSKYQDFLIRNRILFDICSIISAMKEKEIREDIERVDKRIEDITSKLFRKDFLKDDLVAKREIERLKSLENLPGRIFMIRKGHKVVKTFKIISKQGYDNVLFRERIFTRKGVKEQNKIRSVKVLEKELGREIV
jgi:hypothetical protein